MCVPVRRAAQNLDRGGDSLTDALYLHWLTRRVDGKAAGDLAAEVFPAAFTQRLRYDPARDCARPGLYGIATNLVGAHRRQESRYLRALARTGARPPPPGEEDALWQTPGWTNQLPASGR